MKNIVAVLILFLCQSAICQQDKEIIYVDSNNREITKRQVKFIHPSKIYIEETETDTTLIKKVFLRKHLAKLDSAEYARIKAFLAKTIGPGFDENKNTMIHFYGKNNGEIKKAMEYKKYWNWIMINSDDQQAYLFGSKKTGLQTDREKHFYIDPNNTIDKMFFSDSKFENNHVYIKPGGEVYIYYGGDDILAYLDWSLD